MGISTNFGRRTKIVATLGPSTDKPGVLKAILRAGVDVARLNAAHGTPETHARRVEDVRRLSRELGVSVAILLDVPGPKFRLGKLPQALSLARGRTVALARPGTPDALPLSHPALLKDLQPGDAVYLADGTVRLLVTRVSAGKALARVEIGGTVRSGSGVNLPQTRISARMPTPEDRRWLDFARRHRLDWVGISFVRNADEVRSVRRLLGDGPLAPFVMAKIEKREALADLDAVVQAADGVMVARGDLGVETPLEEVPLLQKRIIAKAMEWGKPVITATQMLESMVEQGRPTRAEVADVANAILDGTDAVMLSAETAIGQHPLEAVSVLAGVAQATEARYPHESVFKRLSVFSKRTAIDALCLSACWLSLDLKASALVVESMEDQLPFRLSRYRPSTPILVGGVGLEAMTRFALGWNVAVRPLTRADARRLARQGPVIGVSERGIDFLAGYTARRSSRSSSNE